MTGSHRQMGVAKKENSEGGPSEFNPAEPEGEPVRRCLGAVLSSSGALLAFVTKIDSDSSYLGRFTKAIPAYIPASC
jgi:hypothetical protein